MVLCTELNKYISKMEPKALTWPFRNWPERVLTTSGAAPLRPSVNDDICRMLVTMSRDTHIIAYAGDYT